MGIYTIKTQSKVTEAGYAELIKTIDGLDEVIAHHSFVNLNSELIGFHDFNHVIPHDTFNRFELSMRFQLDCYSSVETEYFVDYMAAIFYPASEEKEDPCALENIEFERIWDDLAMERAVCKCDTEAIVKVLDGHQNSREIFNMLWRLKLIEVNNGMFWIKEK